MWVLGFALGLRLFGTISRITQASLVGAAFAVAIALLLLGINRFVEFNPFAFSMLTGGALVFILAIPSALLPRVLIKSNVEARAS